MAPWKIENEENLILLLFFSFTRMRDDGGWIMNDGRLIFFWQWGKLNFNCSSHLCKAPRDPILVPSTREERVNPINPLLLPNFWADNALSLNTTSLTVACFWGWDKTGLANSHPCSSTQNGQVRLTLQEHLGESSSWAIKVAPNKADLASPELNNTNQHLLHEFVWWKIRMKKISENSNATRIICSGSVLTREPIFRFPDWHE